MKRSVAALAAFTACALLPAAAHAKVIEIGEPADPFTPACPGSPCFVVDRTTGYQAKVGTNRGLMTVPQSGLLVAWSVGLSKPNDKQIAYFESTKNGGKGYGPSQAQITVLTVGAHLHDTVKALGPLVTLKPYFGGTAQFPLPQGIPVKKGDLIAITVPTWAPMLQVGFAGDTSWRASRAKNKCGPKFTDNQTAQTKIGQKAQYACLYRTARLAYTATLIPYAKKTNKPSTKKNKRAVER